MSRTTRTLGLLVMALVVLLGGSFGVLDAQAESLAGQRLGAGYRHVFIAYALAWLLLGGWVVSIGRRMAALQRRLED